MDLNDFTKSEIKLIRSELNYSIYKGLNFTGQTTLIKFCEALTKHLDQPRIGDCYSYTNGSYTTYYKIINIDGKYCDVLTIGSRGIEINHDVLISYLDDISVSQDTTFMKAYEKKLEEFKGFIEDEES